MNGVFNNPWMLLWGLAAVIPLVLYWFRRRTVHRIEWGAMQFLYDASQGPVSHKRLKRRLLLAVRMATVLFVALVAATPLTTAPGSANTASLFSTSHWILVVDVSASMGLRADQTASIEKAAKIAESVISEAGEGDLFSLITSGVIPANRLVSGTANREAVLEALSNIVVDEGAFQFWPVVNDIDQVIQEASEYKIDSTRIVFLSDFHAGDWPVHSGDHDHLPPSIVASGNVVTPQFIICRENDSPNVAIVDVIPEQIHVTIGQTVDCLIEVATAGTPDAWEGDLELHLDGRLVEQQAIRLETGESREYRFTLLAGRTGDLEIEARISGRGTGLEVDDVRFSTVTSHADIKVLCVEGQRQISKSVVSAMSSMPSSGLPVITSSVVDISKLEIVDTRPFDLIVLLGVSGLSPSQTEKLLQHTDNGGGLLISLGPSANRDRWQEFFDATTGNPGWVRLTGEVAQGDFHLDPLDYAHPILSAFRNHPQSGILDVPVHKYHRVALAPEHGSRVLNFGTGDPAAFVIDRRAGQVFVTTTPLASHVQVESPPWNILPAWWSYVPLINETVFWMFGVTEVASDVIVGDEIVWGANELLDTGWAEMTDRLKVRFPNGTLRSIDRKAGQDASWFSTVADQSGFMRIESPTPNADQRDTRSFAANVNRSESDQDPCHMESLRNLFSNASEFRKEGNTTPLAKPNRSRLLYSGFLVLILLLLVTEPWLANRLAFENKGRRE